MTDRASATPSVPNPSWVKRGLIRVAAGVGLLLALGGPTPGYVGSCNGTPVTDAPQFCVDRRRRECLRELMAMRSDRPGYETCVNDIAAMCVGAAWSAGCGPSGEITGACLSALEDPSRYGQRIPEVVECQTATLCGGAPLVSPPDDGI